MNENEVKSFEEKEKDAYINNLKSAIENRDKRISELELILATIEASGQKNFDEDKKIWKYNLILMGELKDSIKSAKESELKLNQSIEELNTLKLQWKKDIEEKVYKPMKIKTNKRKTK